MLCIKGLRIVCERFLENVVEMQTISKSISKKKATIIQKIMKILFTWEDNIRRIKSDTKERPISFLSKMYLYKIKNGPEIRFQLPVSFHLRM